jgi:hypothetical protein
MPRPFTSTLAGLHGLPLDLEFAEGGAHAHPILVNLQAPLVTVEADLAALAVEANAGLVACLAGRGGMASGAGAGAAATRGGGATGAGLAARAGAGAGGAASSALGEAVVFMMVAVLIEACADLALSSVQPPTIPIATAATPPTTKPIFDRSIGVAFLESCAAIAAVSEFL